MTNLTPYLLNSKQQRAAALCLKIEKAKRRKSRNAPVWKPHSANRPQCEAYHTPAFETLYGGAAGGGKTDLLLGLARTSHRRSLLLRRTFPDLERSLISRSFEFFGDSKYYNGSKHVWNIDNRRIEFGHMDRVGTATQPGSEVQYASAPYDFIGFDQLEQFPQYAYEFMLSRARTTIPGQKVRIVASANPVGEYLDWIMTRWGAWLDETHPNPAKPGELRWYKRDERGNEIETSADDPDGISRTFIPAGLKDNPYLGDDYRRVLNLMPEPLRSALLNGDWLASLTDDAYQVIPRAWVKAAQARWTPEGGFAPLTCMGVDVARGGDDQTVKAKRHAYWVAQLEKHPGRSTPDGQSVAALIIQDVGGTKIPVNIDVIGIGASAYDIAKEKCRATPINFAEKSEAVDASGQLSFVNRRAECWWRVRDLLDPVSGHNVALPPDPELLGDLIAPRWTMMTNGIKIEPKEDIKQRIGRSPDCGDAVTLVFAPSVASLPDRQPEQKSKWSTHDYSQGGRWSKMNG